MGRRLTHAKRLYASEESFFTHAKKIYSCEESLCTSSHLRMRRQLRIPAVYISSYSLIAIVKLKSSVSLFLPVPIQSRSLRQRLPNIVRVSEVKMPVIHRSGLCNEPGFIEGLHDFIWQRPPLHILQALS